METEKQLGKIVEKNEGNLDFMRLIMNELPVVARSLIFLINFPAYTQ